MALYILLLGLIRVLDSSDSGDVNPAARPRQSAWLLAQVSKISQAFELLSRAPELFNQASELFTHAPRTIQPDIRTIQLGPRSAGIIDSRIGLDVEK